MQGVLEREDFETKIAQDLENTAAVDIERNGELEASANSILASVHKSAANVEGKFELEYRIRENILNWWSQLCSDFNVYDASVRRETNLGGQYVEIDLNYEEKGGVESGSMNISYFMPRRD